jgi:hypothetical protein
MGTYQRYWFIFLGIFYLNVVSPTHCLAVDDSKPDAPSAPTATIGADCETPLKPVPHHGPISFEDAREEVLSLLKRRARALRLSRAHIQRLEMALDAPENRKYFDHDPAILKALYDLPEGHYPSVSDYADAVFAAFLLAEERRETGLTWRRIRHYFFDKGVKFVRAVFWIIIGGAILGPVQQLSSGFSAPVLQPLVAEGNAAIFRAYPEDPVHGGTAGRDAIMGPDGRPVNGSPYSTFFYEAWREANARIPLNQREGRSHYYEVVSSLLLAETVISNRAPLTPVTEPDAAARRQSLDRLRQFLQEQPLIFPDVYTTDYGRRTLDPWRLRLIQEIDQSLLTY